MLGTERICTAFKVRGTENMKFSSSVWEVLMRTDSWTDKRTLKDLS
jgi:hypothetical protein